MGGSYCIIPNCTSEFKYIKKFETGKEVDGSYNDLEINF